MAAYHGGLELKKQLIAALEAAGHEVAGFGAHELVRRCSGGWTVPRPIAVQVVRWQRQINSTNTIGTQCSI